MLPWQQEVVESLAFTPQNASRRETFFLSTIDALAALNTATTAANDDNEVPWAKFLADKAAYVYNWWTDDSDPNTTCGSDLYRDWADDVNESYSAYATASGAAYLSMAGTIAAANDTYYASTPDDNVDDDDGDADDLPDVSSPDGAERWSAAMAEAESDYLDTLAAAELQLAVDTEAAGEDETALAAAQADYDAAVSAAELAYQVAAAEADGDAAVADAEAVDDYIDDVYGEDGDYDTWQSAVTGAESAYETAASSAWSGLQKNLGAHDAALESALADTYAKAMEELADDFPGNPWAARAAADARAESDKIADDQSAQSTYADSVNDAKVAFDTALATADAARTESQADALRTSLQTQSDAAVTRAENQAAADEGAAGDGVGTEAEPESAEPEEAAEDVTRASWDVDAPMVELSELAPTDPVDVGRYVWVTQTNCITGKTTRVRMYVPTAAEQALWRELQPRSRLTYQAAIDKYNQELLDYYHRIMKELVKVGDSISRAGFTDLPEPYCNNYYTTFRYEYIVFGLYASKTRDASKFFFPSFTWETMSGMIQYADIRYTKIGKGSVYLVSNDVGGNNFPFIEGMRIGEISFHTNEQTALDILIHEAQHEFWQLGLDMDPILLEDHIHIRYYFASDTDSKEDNVFSTYINFLQSVMCGNKSLWDHILAEAGPKPAMPPKPRVLNDE